MKKALTIALTVMFVLSIALQLVSANDLPIPTMTHKAEYKWEGRTDMERQVGHYCNTGAEQRVRITGEGQMSRSSDIIISAGKLTVDKDSSEFVTAEDAIDNLIVTSSIRLCAPPKARYTITQYVPVEIESATIDPTEADFDLNDPVDVETTITWNDTSEVKNVSGHEIGQGDWSVDNDTLTIESGFLQSFAENDELTFTIEFDVGDDATLEVKIIDTEIGYTLTIASTEGGSVTDPGEGTFTYIEDEVVDLEAVADTGYIFTGWTGDTGEIDDTDAASTFITMNDDYSVTASFVEVITGFTVEAWVIWNDEPGPPEPDEQWATIVVDGNADHNSRYHLQHNHNNTAFEVAMRADTRVFTLSTTEPEQGVWYYLVGVYNQDDEQLRLYVNGELESSRTLTGDLIPSPGMYQVGGPDGITFHSSDNTRKFNGDIEGLGTHERAFTEIEIENRFNAGRP